MKPENEMIRLLLPLSILFLLVLGCDPGVRFRPSGWEKLNEGTFQYKYDGFDIVMGSIGDLVLMKNADAHGCIYNRGESEAKFEVVHATLKADGIEYQGVQDFSSAYKIEPIGPQSCQPFEIKFDFNKTLDRALKDPVELDLTIKTSTKVLDVSIPMTDTNKDKND